MAEDDDGNDGMMTPMITTTRQVTTTDNGNAANDDRQTGAWPDWSDDGKGMARSVHIGIVVAI